MIFTSPRTAGFKRCCESCVVALLFHLSLWNDGRGQESVGELVSQLTSRIESDQILYLKYDCEGAFYQWNNDELVKELPHDSGVVEFWLAPHKPSVRKLLDSHELSIDEDGHNLLSVTYDVIFDQGKILQKVGRPEQSYEYQLGDDLSVATGLFRDEVDIPIYATCGLPSLDGELSFFVVAESANDGHKLFSSKASGTKTVRWSNEIARYEFELDDRLALKSYASYWGEAKTPQVSCQVESHQIVENLYVPADYTFVRQGFSPGTVLQRGRRRLVSADLIADSSVQVFDTSIPTGSVVMEDRDPRQLKIVSSDGSLDDYHGVKAERSWLRLVLLGSLMSMVFLFFFVQLRRIKRSNL